jgi:hypothetical protein
MAVQPLAQGMHGLARELEFASQAGGRFTLGDATQQEYQHRRTLAIAFIGKSIIARSPSYMSSAGESIPPLHTYWT